MSFVITKTGTSFQCILPPCIIFGTGVATRAAEQAKNLGISKTLVVTDKGVANTEGCKVLVEGLKAGGVNPTVWSEVQVDPPDTSIEGGVKVYLEGKFDGLIAIGGGSSMD
ncbi:unnamed protein product, partial [marine sediment metagenome]